MGGPRCTRLLGVKEACSILAEALCDMDVRNKLVSGLAPAASWGTGEKACPGPGLPSRAEHHRQLEPHLPRPTLPPTRTLAWRHAGGPPADRFPPKPLNRKWRAEAVSPQQRSEQWGSRDRCREKCEMRQLFIQKQVS